MLLMLSFRVGQPRVAVGALPLILLGGAWYLAGPQTARLCAFPLLFFWLCIPLPSFQQATVGLQIIATELGHWGASIFGAPISALPADTGMPSILQEGAAACVP